MKRRQVPTACSRCRMKKKRCVHHQHAEEEQGDTSAAAPDALPLPPVPASTTAPPLPPLAATAELSPEAADRPALSESPPAPVFPASSGTPISASSRFIGDSNPEGMFVEAADIAAPARPDADADAEKEDMGTATATGKNGHVGIWFSGAAGSAGPGPVARAASHSIPLLQRLLSATVLQSECLSSVPARDDYARLRNTFVTKIHPIFPFLPLPCLSRGGRDGADDEPDTAAAVLVRQLVSLAASADPDMAPHLRLGSGGPPLPAAEFGSAVSSAIRALLETDLIGDRILRIRAHLVLSLYLQPSGPGQADLPSQMGSRAMHDVQTLGMQVMRYDAGEGGEELEILFCLAWAIDRLNAATYGRPVIMHERDIGSDLDGSIRRRDPCFRLLLLVVRWLDQVIGLYRAGMSYAGQAGGTAASIDLPVLETLIVEAGALKVPGHLIATIEVLYHAVVILSCRLCRPTCAIRDGTPPAPPPPSANARRSLAAERIGTAVSSPRDRLSPVPFVPYAVSLALSVEYRKMRHSRLPMFRARARDAFARHCELLLTFAGFFWAARVVSGLGNRMLREMEKAAAGARALGGLAGPGRIGDASSAAASSAAASRAEPTTPDGGYSGPTGPTGHTDLADHTPADANPGGSLGFDLFTADPVGDEEVFRHFDPNFNILAVDHAIEANLDVTLPLNWLDWDSFLQ